MSLAVFCRLLSSSGDNLRPDSDQTVSDLVLSEGLVSAGDNGGTAVRWPARESGPLAPSGWVGAREKLVVAGAVQVGIWAGA